MERIIIDMDEVIADPMGAMIDWYKEKYAGEIDYKKMLAGSWIVGFPEEHQKLIWERLHSPGFFRNLPVMDNSVEVLEELNKRYEVFIVSAAMEFPQSLSEKYEWLQEHFPFITWNNIIFCGDKSIIGTDYMIDDHVKNLDCCKGKTIMFTAGHNAGVDRHHRANNWKEVLAFFDKEVVRESTGSPKGKPGIG